MEAYSDTALMIKVKTGDLDKMGLLFERYKRPLFGFFYHMGHGHNTSEDLVQNVFMRMLKYKHTFGGHGEFRAWMYHIARNVHADHIKAKKVPTRALENWMEHDPEVLEDNSEALGLMRKAMDQLATDQREVLVLCKLNGIRYRQAGLMLGCSEGAVKVKVYRAMKALKQVYSQLLIKP